MIKQGINDTIAAISTGLGESGIGIVRLSGKEALAIADKIFLAKDGKKPSDFKTYTTHYGWIIENQKSKIKNQKYEKPQEFIDEVILTVMRSPCSYTKEDIVEINCHGGIVAQRAVMDLVLASGARLAEPGEFTKRAFLNGRIDLAQAEAVLDIIRAKTDAALKISTEQLKGALSREINKVRAQLLAILATLEANIDFPEEEIGAIDLAEIAQDLKQADNALKNLLGGSQRARIFREGVQVVICGKPNVGKSSLLNALLKQERSIVTSIPGTTRDTIEEIIDIKGIPIRIVDTAGILEPRDLVEKKAVQRAKKYIALADLVVLLFDGSKKLNREDAMLVRKLKQKKVVAAINKIDLKQKIERDKIFKNFKSVVEISAKKLKNINLFEEMVARLVYNGKVSANESALVSNLRHIRALKEAEKLIAEARDSLDNRLSLEFIAQDLKDALLYLDGILGNNLGEDLLDKIFAEFCIGK